ncbi:site-2 protease family protein [Catenisphaera adipataccumulans]|uniref:Zn-dependent protease n=1 Tax=Catenisphaera adipataccumulans TaxID=700500 RepID=A0A7W8CXZ3_9FIRM|nr:site-2 protease family protein [Catenisphaera adipataccumulans]MBB5182015.1 Zn-dependent protease [Catenisphaera adipataccumulans]
MYSASELFQPLNLLSTLLAVILAMGVHEAGHAWAAWKLGDPTAKQNGRLTLNPFEHVDWFGLICLVFFGFGWAKPVDVDPRYFRNPKGGMAWTAFAGPAANFVLGFLCVLGTLLLSAADGSALAYILSMVLSRTAILSVGFGIFNLIPIPPLDGAKVLYVFLPDETYFRVNRGSPVFLIAFIIILYTGVFDTFLQNAEVGILAFFLHICEMITGI